MDKYNEKITLGQFFKLLLSTNRFDSAKCTIWDNSKVLYADKIGYMKGYIISGKLAEVSNSEYLFNRRIKDFHIKGFFKNRIDIVVSCSDLDNIPFSSNKDSHSDYHLKSVEDQNYNNEQFFRKRYNMDLKHGLLQGNCGSGKTKAVKLEIERILVNTNDDIIIIDNDGLYEDFCGKNNGKYINIDEDREFFDNNITTIKNRLIVLDIYRLYEHLKSSYALKALEYANKRVNEQSETKKYTWIYIDEVDELLCNNYFYDMLEGCRKDKGIITVVTNKLVDIIENDNMRRLLPNIEFVRLFNQSPRNQEILSNYFFIDSKVLAFDDKERSLIIIRGETVEIKDADVTTLA